MSNSKVDQYFDKAESTRFGFGRRGTSVVSVNSHLTKQNVALLSSHCRSNSVLGSHEDHSQK